MTYQIAPLSDFIRNSDRTPMSLEEYRASTRPKSTVLSDPIEDRVDISSERGRNVLLGALSSRLAGNGSSALFRSLIPSESALGASYGLYAGVGELPAYKVKSLISLHV